MAAEAAFGFIRKIDQDSFDPNLDWNAFSVQVLAAVEIMLVDNGAPKQPFRAENEV